MWHCRGTVQEVDEVLTKARMFQHKPDGDVIFHTYQDARGTPISTFQDPLHYPHGTKFLAPGAFCWAKAHSSTAACTRGVLRRSRCRSIW